MVYKCTICEEKMNFNCYWSFCFDCRSFVCQKCTDEFIEAEIEDGDEDAYDPLYKNQTCVECDKHYFIDEVTDLKRIITNLKDKNPTYKNVLHFYNAVFRLNGFGCNVDHSEAFSEIFISVHLKSFLPAMQMLGAMFANGTGTEQDLDQSHKYFLRCAMQGFVESIYCVGLDFLKGHAVEKDEDEAMFYIKIAANKKYKPAYMHLSHLYRQNLDFKEAKYWEVKHRFETNVDNESRPGMADIFTRGRNSHMCMIKESTKNTREIDLTSGSPMFHQEVEPRFPLRPGCSSSFSPPIYDHMRHHFHGAGSASSYVSSSHVYETLFE